MLTLFEGTETAKDRVLVSSRPIADPSNSVSMAETRQQYSFRTECYTVSGMMPILGQCRLHWKTHSKCWRFNRVMKGVV